MKKTAMSILFLCVILFLVFISMFACKQYKLDSNKNSNSGSNIIINLQVAFKVGTPLAESKYYKNYHLSKMDGYSFHADQGREESKITHLKRTHDKLLVESVHVHTSGEKYEKIKSNNYYEFTFPVLPIGVETDNKGIIKRIIISGPYLYRDLLKTSEGFYVYQEAAEIINKWGEPKEKNAFRNGKTIVTEIWRYPEHKYEFLVMYFKEKPLNKRISLIYIY